MTLQTDLNTLPYYDDYDPKKDFYRILFKPSVAVQAREMNQLQSILQSQIERFGDNIFKRGTIIDGCNVTFHSMLPYIKIQDVETDGTPVDVTLYDSLFIKNATGVTAAIVKTVSGFESQSPDLNTLFVRYNNSGSDANTATVSDGDTLTVYSPNYPIFSYRVIDGSSSFSKNDTVVVISAIAIQNTTGGTTFANSGFTITHNIQNGVANATIMEANSTANSGVILLKIRPLAVDLKAANNILWKFNNSETIFDSTASQYAKIVGVVGSGAEGSLLTDALGKVTSIAVVDQGSGYYYPPYVSVSITSGSTSILNSQIDQLSVTPRNYLSTITVANTAFSPVGTGYALTVDEGIVYQKGFFSRVSKQLIVVNKYSNTGFSKSVGFATDEEIIDSNQDESLLDNATGSFNYTAPGADRLKLTPTLVVMDKSDADSNTAFLPIVEFADGLPYKQEKQTVYNVIGDELARRTYEESGNYVIDQFNLITKDSDTFADTSSKFKIFIDPGKAYIRGYRVETVDNFTANVDKGNDTVSVIGAQTKISYGNYVLIKELGGVFEFNIGAQVDLYNTAKAYLSTSTFGSGSAITASGTKIGTARMRSLVLDSGKPGTADAVYRMYLFDIVMDAGYNFGNVRSLYYGGTNKGVADVVLSDSGDAVLNDTGNEFSGLLFKSENALKIANSVTYTYRTFNSTLTTNTTGYIAITPGAGTSFPYSGELTSTAKDELLVIPLADYKASSNGAGALATSSASPNVTGTSTTFNTDYRAGDFVKVANTTQNLVAQISQVVNSTHLILTSNASITFSTANGVLYFPNNVPIPLSRSGRTANVSSIDGSMTIYVGNSVQNTSGSSVNANVAVAYNVTSNASLASKTIHRNVFSRLVMANNAVGHLGPWPLGVTDVFRLRHVYVANGASVALTFNANTDVDNTADFITISNNPFANGDSVVYSNTTGTTVVGGLSNATTYYAVYSNTTGMALSATRNGANVNITANTVSETHTLTGSPIFFTADTNYVSDVTNDYYIDHNQNEDFLDISFLYLKPRITAPGNTDVLLVEFDCFTTGAGVKTVDSYSIDDTIDFDTLSNSKINTMEIPEVFGKGGNYYDLRDQFDFRPNAANTITLITSDISNTSIVNPAEPNDAARFSTSEKLFPVPDSTITANLTFYQGRNDRVVLDINGNFDVIKGVPGVLNSFPAEPSNSLTVQYLRIPPYPSLPQSLSADMIKIIDTKMASENFLKRRNNFKIVTPIDVNQQSRIQVKNYTMTDISALEKRISDLEYYVVYTLAESIAQSRYIPSSSNTNINRAKFGYFVDPFTNYQYSEITHPEYYATIVDDLLNPHQEELNIQFVFDNQEDLSGQSLSTLNFDEYTLIAQLDATEYVNADGNTTTVNTVSVTQSTTIVVQQEKTRAQNNSGTVYEDYFYTYSSIAGPAALYAAHRDNWTAFEISQSETVGGTYSLVTSSAAAEGINATDISERKLAKGDTQGIFGDRVEHIGTIQRAGFGPVGGFLDDHQKILWQHDPAGGQYIRIRVYKGGTNGNEGTSGTYKFKLFYPRDNITETTVSTSNPGSFTYQGIVRSVTPLNFTIHTSTVSIPGISDIRIVADNQKFTISVTGLKPSTYHKFVFDNVDKTDKCVQVRTSTVNTAGLLTDVNGSMTFDFYYDAGINEATSDFEQQNKIAASVAGSKRFTIESYVAGSGANGLIQIGSNFNGASTPVQAPLSSQLTGSTSATQTVTSTNPYDYSSDLANFITQDVNGKPTLDLSTIVFNLGNIGLP